MAMRILLIEDNAGDVGLIREVLRNDDSMELAVATTLDGALRLSADEFFDVALVDLGLPDSTGLDSVVRLQKQAPHLAIIVFTGSDDDKLAVQAARSGAQDYMVKGRVNLDLLRRSLRYAVARKQAEDQIRDAGDRLRALTVRLQDAREEERSAIAVEIHDRLGQDLTALKLDIAWLQSRLQNGAEDTAKMREKTSAMLPLVDGLIRTVQRISLDLRPRMLDDLGLASAMEWYVDGFRERTGLDVELALPAHDLALDSARSTTFYRVLQEALTNVARHSGASRVEVSLHVADESLVMEVRDNGVGIPPERIHDRNSLGLLGMRERVEPLGGSLLIRADPRQGTAVNVSLPLGPSS